MIKLGSRVRDSITGFEGIAVIRSEHLYGCVHIGITPTILNKDGSTIRPEFFDEQRVLVLEEMKPEVSPASSAVSGGILLDEGGGIESLDKVNQTF